MVVEYRGIIKRAAQKVMCINSILVYKDMYESMKNEVKKAVSKAMTEKFTELKNSLNEMLRLVKDSTLIEKKLREENA